MPVYVKLSTSLRNCVAGYNPLEGLHVDMPFPATIGDLATRLKLPQSEIKIVMQNGVRAELKNSLADGDRVAFFPAVGGG